jgi:hypothetical protein
MDLKTEIAAKQQELTKIFAAACMPDGSYDWLRVPGMERYATQYAAWRVVDGLCQEQEYLCQILNEEEREDRLIERIAQRVVQRLQAS